MSQCPENYPACNNCIKIKVLCSYPSQTSISPQPQIQNEIQDHRDMVLPRMVQNMPTVFSLTDLRLFHHFLITCSPILPLGNSKVWVTHIASFAHEVSCNLRRRTVERKKKGRDANVCPV